MRWYNSLITKITVIFTIAIIGVGAVMYIIHNQIKEFELRSVTIYTKALLANSQKNGKLDLDILQQAGYIPITDDKLKDKIFSKKKPIPKLFKGDKYIQLKAVAYNTYIYVILGENLIFKAPHDRKIFPKILLPITVIALMLFLYIAIIRSIMPIYTLRRKVKEFANGNFDIDCKSNKKDEIGILSNEFDNSVKKIKKLRDSRQLFLRNIMHELKTPITKGKLSCEMIEQSTYQNILQNVFRRQEVLLDEFARIEKLSANELAINRKEYALQDILDFSFDILNHDIKSFTCRINPMHLKVDFELFGTALKNLIDNGVNYSDDKHVLIESNENQIIISNSGKELEFPLENYAEPYFLDGKKSKSSRGLGFGLFITLNIIRLHQMKIEYNRKNDRNIFKIHVKKS